ncbi:hypothetical protein GRS96_01260 [Rathayibacter sp. VKM Ac-2803]|uniref:hypothetical protein n=1 Tax=Rathayibacter sp. VKM Ac-2803 TaxID=2609256 RepID=UPI0013581ED8|nr:hypothetical protein [Rathayibacter sp. VKM Ac-2803]MWV47899.1 hypothetical protein [Rathayibacter sp. VKM Ac-2803]
MRPSTAAAVVFAAVAVLCGCTAPSAVDGPTLASPPRSADAVLAVIGDVPEPVAPGSAFDAANVLVSRDGSPVPDVTVTFHVASGPAAFEGEVLAVQTDADGIATAADLVATEGTGDVELIASAGDASLTVRLEVE